VSSTDGLAPIRDFLFFGSLSFLASEAAMSRQLRFSKKIANVLYALGGSTLLAYTLSFFPILHIYAGVTLAYPSNYIQLFLAAAPPTFLGAAIASGKNKTFDIRIRSFSFICGLSGIEIGIMLAVTLPCEACSGYGFSIASILAIGAAFSLGGAAFGEFISKKIGVRRGSFRKHSIQIVTLAIIILAVTVLLTTYFVANYEASVVNQFPGIENSNYSPLEVGSAFPYGAGYLTTPKGGTQAVGVTLSFGNTRIANTNSNFLAAGVGVQSPNCCKDGLDLAYRTDALMFSNGNEAVVARAWWACDTNMAC
jgi:hypothetical protein